MPHADEFTYRWEPGDSRRPVMLVLHGTGGDENGLLPIARMIDGGAPVLSPRGRVLENGMPRFFRRLAEGVFDQEDLRFRTRELSQFVDAAALRHGFDASRIVVVGYSNGANIAASMLLTDRAEFTARLAGAVLLRPMVPFEPAGLPALHGTSVLISASRQDALVPAASTERLAELLASAGAAVATRWYPTGHGLSPQEIPDAAAWYAARFRAPGVAPQTPGDRL